MTTKSKILAAIKAELERQVYDARCDLDFINLDNWPRAGLIEGFVNFDSLATAIERAIAE